MIFPLFLSLFLAATPPKNVNITSYHGGNDRLGWNSNETILTPENVSSKPEFETSPRFDVKWRTPLDGFVNGSPLAFNGAIYAVTENNSAFALNARSGDILWQTTRLMKTLSAGQFNGDWNSSEKHGVLSTPVIDEKTKTLYFCGPEAHGLVQNFVVFALDTGTGKVKPGWPVKLSAKNRSARFTAGQVMQRGALSLANGWLMIPFGGRGDVPPWRGWVVGIDTKAPHSPQRSFCLSPDTDGAGVWSAGGVSADEKGNCYIVTGNGDYDLFRGGNNLGQTVVRLDSQLKFSKRAEDYYTPANYQFLDEQDEDLGGASALVLPDIPDSSTPHLLFTGGKDGCAYLLDRDRLGGIGGELQRTRLFAAEKATYHEGIRATSAYFDAGDAGRLIFVPGDNPGDDGNLGLVALKLLVSARGEKAHFVQVWNAKKDLARPGSPVVSSDGAKNAIVWLIEFHEDGDSYLDAFDALSGKQLTSRRFSGGRRFVSPTVANGSVYVGAEGVICYGISPKRLRK